MPSKTIPFRELTIIGYSPVPDPIGRPNIVTMVFQHDDHLLFAPYRLTEEGLQGASADTTAVFKSRVEAGTAVRLSAPINAQPDHLLWIDRDGNASYEPQDEVFKHLRGESDDVLMAGQEALRKGDYDRALKLSQNALRIDEENICALVLSGAAYRALHNEPFVEQLAKSADAIMPGFPFHHHVDRSLRTVNVQHPVAACIETVVDIAAQLCDDRLKGIAIIPPSRCKNLPAGKAA